MYLDLNSKLMAILMRIVNNFETSIICSTSQIDSQIQKGNDNRDILGGQGQVERSGS